MGLICLMLASANLAMGQPGSRLPGDPFFLALGNTPVPPNSSVTFYYSLVFRPTTGPQVNSSSFVVVANPTSSTATYTDTQLATQIATNLNQDTNVSPEYTCNVERTIFGYMEVICLPNPNMSPSVLKTTVDPRGAPDMIMSSGTWQADADAHFEIDGTPSASSSDEVFLGVDGYIVDTPTATNGVPKTLQAIRQELVNQLLNLGFSNANLNANNLIVTNSNPDGDPPPVGTGTGDWGGLVFTTDPGLIVTAQMINGNQLAARPPRGTVTAPATAAAGTMIMVSISGFPAANINITVNGQAVGTIMGPSGSTTITLPAGPKGIPLEIRGAGGGTFGYAWITLN
ncbi:MAG TPA: hypothetical protein VKB79_12420 [Bryobacteraceae bacterium]|nr:hypothetical protein [Bryobacteraceae bacterium]